MQIFRPIDSNHLTQGFGKNNACRSRSGHVISKRGQFCPAGYKDFYISIGMKGHNGEDWATWYKEPVFFPVIADTKWYARTGMDIDGGLGVDVFSDSPLAFSKLPPQAGQQAAKHWRDNNGKMYVKFRFWHGNANAVADGQEVKEGTFIQYADSTGASSGNHLHWSMKFVDKDGNTLDRDNGFYGAVDFSEYYKNTYILKFLEVRAEALSAIDLARKMVFEAQIIIRKLLKL